MDPQVGLHPKMGLCYNSVSRTVLGAPRRKDDMSERKVLTVSEVAVDLRSDVKTIYKAISAGQIPAIRVGRKILIPRDSYSRWLEEGGPIEAA